MMALHRLKAIKEQAESNWVRQAAVLYETDIEWLMGDRRAAFASFRKGFSSDHERPGRGFEGGFARWMTMLLVKDQRIARVKELLEEYYRNIEHFDLMDQAEILCSIEYVRLLTGGQPSEATDKARGVLSRLPIACSHQLQQLGLLLPN